jgi:hypothetical protein
MVLLDPLLSEFAVVVLVDALKGVRATAAQLDALALRFEHELPISFSVRPTGYVAAARWPVQT